MKKIVYSFWALFVLFVWNLFAYFLIPWYSLFLKKQKYTNQDFDYHNISDDYTLDFDEKKPQEDEVEDYDDDIIDILDFDFLENSDEDIWENIKDVLPEDQRESAINMFSPILYILKDFELNLQEPQEYYQIFGITDEYPNEYLHYFSNFWDIYYFYKSNDIDEIYRFFEITNEGDYILNQVNNFGNASFYINATDWNVRIIIDAHNMIIGLLIQESYYYEIKDILNNF